MNIKRKKNKKKKKRREPGTGRRAGKVERKRGENVIGYLDKSFRGVGESLEWDGSVEGISVSPCSAHFSSLDFPPDLGGKNWWARERNFSPGFPSLAFSTLYQTVENSLFHPIFPHIFSTPPKICPTKHTVNAVVATFPLDISVFLSLPYASEVYLHGWNFLKGYPSQDEVHFIDIRQVRRGWLSRTSAFEHLYSSTYYGAFPNVLSSSDVLLLVIGAWGPT